MLGSVSKRQSNQEYAIFQVSFYKLPFLSLLSILTYIFNLSLFKGNFPNNWEKARVPPIFKEGLPNERSNYRPISVLPVLSRHF